MNIDVYLQHSRRTKQTSPVFDAIYSKRYEKLTSLATKKFGFTVFPQLRTTYSPSRKCEWVRFGTDEYIIFDQYLGQTMNRVNRILAAKHGARHLSLSYGCKYLAELLVCENSLRLAAILAGSSHEFERKANEEGNPFHENKSMITKRSHYVIVQEFFALAHEFAHFLNSKDRSSNPKLRISTEKEVTRFLRNRSKHRSNYAVLKARYGSKVARMTMDEGPETYKYLESLFKQEKSNILPEMVCDFVAAIYTVHVATQDYGIPFIDVAPAVVLAFKCMRLFEHLNMFARAVYECEASRGSVDWDKRVNGLPSSIWGEQEGNRKEGGDVHQ